MQNDDYIKISHDPVEIKSNYIEKKIIEPVEIDISQAQAIHLPKLKYEPSPDPNDSIKQDWDKYNTITRKAKLFYNTKKYQKAKDEWLKIYDWYHRDELYKTYLIRTYRKLIDEANKKKLYNESILYLEELFERCTNHTTSDIKNYNNVATHLNKLNQNTTSS